jgi:hypothetical protein
MADKKISALTSATTPLAGTEVLPIVQSSATVKVTVDNLTVKNVRSNATSGLLQVTGPASASTRVMTTPDANFTVARTDAAQTFTGIQTFSSGVATASGSTASTTAVAVTLFAVSPRGRYEIYADINANDATYYAAFATVVMDGSSARIVANNTTNLLLTLSGTNVQGTQVSGADQTIRWGYLKIV